jgi:two-component sensor histidine kinase
VTPADLELILPLSRTDRAPYQARRALVQEFGPSLDPEQLENAKLLINEIVTNALLHGEGDIVLRASLDEHRLLVEVTDQGSGFERTLRERDFDQVVRHGLELVDSVASRWGIHEGTTHVWFELEQPGPRLGPRTVFPKDQPERH